MWTHRALWPAGLAALTLGLASTASAAEPASPFEAMATLHWTQPLDPTATPAPAPAPDAAPAAPAAQVQAAADAAKVASDTALDDASGRGTDNTSVAMTEQTLSAINTGNTIKADTVSSGAISLQDNALSGFAGIGNILMNTGHNNNLESNMSVTVIVTP